MSPTPTDPFTDSSNWIIWPMKSWPWPVRVCLVLLMVIVFGWFVSNRAMPAASTQDAPANDDHEPAMLKVTPDVLLAAEVIGVLKHERTCHDLSCSSLGCPFVDADDNLVILLMPGEYVAVLPDKRVIRSSGVSPPEAAVVRCDSDDPP